MGQQELQTSQKYFAQLIGTLGSERVKLQDVLNRLHDDIENKRRSLQLDLAALQMDSGSGEACGDQTSRSWLRRATWSGMNDDLLKESATARYVGHRICSKASTIAE